MKALIPVVLLAATAAAQAQRLMTEHDIQQAMLAIENPSAAEPEEAIEDFGKKGAELYEIGEKLATWKWRLCSAICKASLFSISRRSSMNTNFPSFSIPTDGEDGGYGKK